MQTAGVRSIGRTHADEAGMAMITAILVSLVVLFLGFVATGLSDHSFSSSRVDRKRITTFHAAEAGIDHALQVLQSTPLASLPCAIPLANSLGGGAYAPDYAVSFTYYANYPVSGGPMACPLASQPAAVVLSSTGDSSDPLGGRRAMEITARLWVPTGLGAFDRTVFSDAAIELDGHVDIAGNAGDADVYTNGAYNCDQAQTLAGNVYVQGAATLSKGCNVAGELWARSAVSADSVTVGRDLISGTSTISLTNSSKVSGNAEAAGTITKDVSSSILGHKLENSTKVVAPPSSAFPVLTYTASAWNAAGYATPTAYTNCSTALSDLTTLAPTWTTPTVVQITGCRLDTTATTTISINANVAIVSDQGFNLASGTRFKAITPTSHLHLIVPYGSSCAGALGRLVMGQATAFDVPLRVFAYTPCQLYAQNIGTMHGQLYGGAVHFANFDMAYRPVDSIPGYTPVTLSVARRVVVVAKREIAN